MEKRAVHLDLLRVIAIFCVVLLHVAASKWYSIPVTSFDWQTLNFYDSLVRFCVPVFVMLSGCFLLDPEKKVPISVIYKKNILRLIQAYFFWSGLYALFFTILKFKNVSLEAIKFFVFNFIDGNYHLWFLFLLVGLYMLIPIFKKITEDKNVLLYFIVFNFIVSIFLPSLKIYFPQLITNGYYLKFVSVLDRLSLNFVVGFSGYFASGYFIYKYGINKFAKKMIYILGAIGLVFTIVFSSYKSINTGVADGSFYGYLTLNVYFVSIAIFVFFKETASKIKFGVRSTNYIMFLSKYSFGVYLIHDFFNILLSGLGISVVSYLNPVLTVPLHAIIVFSSSFICIYLMSKISFLRRFSM